jgi:hypothetical protein
MNASLLARTTDQGFPQGVGPASRAETPVGGGLVDAVGRLEDVVRRAVVHPPVAAELSARLAALDRALRGGDATGATDQLDLFVLAVQRNLATDVPLRTAAELVETAVLDVKRFVADPADVFAGLVPFALAYYAIENVAPTRVDRRARPIAKAAIGDTARAMTALVQSFDLPLDSRTRLLDAIDALARQAAQTTPGVDNPDLEKRFFATITGFNQELLGLVGVRITAAQRRRLLGLVVAGGPAATGGLLAGICSNPLGIVAQVALVAAGLLGLIWWLSSDNAAVTAAMTQLQTFATNVTANTNRRPGAAQISAALTAATAGLSVDDLKTVRERVQGLADATTNATLTAIFSQWLRELDAVIAAGG